MEGGANAPGGGDFGAGIGGPGKVGGVRENLIRLSGYTLGVDMHIKYTGLRPGEKLYEELLTEVESTQMTRNKKIRIAQADKIDSKELRIKVIKLIGYAKETNITGAVRVMKQIVPEFKSNNSEFEVFDKEKLVTHR